jgi:hypothetical protein
VALSVQSLRWEQVMGMLSALPGAHGTCELWHGRFSVACRGVRVSCIVWIVCGLRSRKVTASSPLGVVASSSNSLCLTLFFFPSERSSELRVIPSLDSNNWYQSHVQPLSHHVRLLSPVPRRSRHSGREVVIERIFEKVTTTIVYPILTHTNYAEWPLVMRVNL